MKRHVIEIGDKGYILAVPFVNSKFNDVFVKLQDAVNNMNVNNLPVVMMAHMAVNGCDFFGHDVSRLVGGFETEDLKSLGDGYDYLDLRDKPIRSARRIASLRCISVSCLCLNIGSFDSDFHFARI